VKTELGESRLFRGGLWIGGAHDDAATMRSLMPVYWDQSFTVGFVRNPWAWWHSAYYWYNEPRHSGFDFTTRFPTFREFIMRWAEWRPGFPWCGYHGFLCNEYGDVLVDYVGRTERLQQDFELICDKTGFPKSRLACKPSRVDYRPNYDDEMKAIVATCLSPKDLVLFPYEFDDGGDL
jgi:hypothetical protein